MPVFDVDLRGLSQLIEDQGPGRLITELVRNSLDEDGVTEVSVTLSMEPGRPLCHVVVIDNAPGGFADLSHAWTLFAPSYKKTHAEKAGRFNMGDKLFLAAAVMTGERATILSTTGGVRFFGDERQRLRMTLPAGSSVDAYLKMTRQQYHEEVLPLLRRLIVKPSVAVSVNGERLASREPVHTFKASLPTVLADEEGVLRQRTRETTVGVYEPLPGETPSLYELGVPVVETGDRYDLEIGQKIPLNMQRDNVPPSYLRTLRTIVLNEMRDRLTAGDATATWVKEATSDERAEPEAVSRVLDLRFGVKRVAADPSDPEATKNAVSKGYTVIHGGMLSRGEWENARKTNTVLPAGKLFPTRHAYEGGPGSPPVEFIPQEKWTPAMLFTARYPKFLGWKLLGREVIVRFVDPRCRLLHFAACWCDDELHYNVLKLGHKWFGRATEDVDKLVTHELGHAFSPDHLSEAYHDGLCTLAARMKKAVLEDPEGFKEFLVTPPGS